MEQPSPNAPEKPAVLIPSENTSNTNTFILLEPVGKNSKQTPTVVEKNSAIPSANNKEIKDTLDRLKAMVRRRKHFALDLSPRKL